MMLRRGIKMKKSDLKKMMSTVLALVLTGVLFGCLFSALASIGLTWAVGQLGILEIDLTLENVVAVALVLWAIMLVRGGLNVEAKRT